MVPMWLLSLPLAEINLAAKKYGLDPWLVAAIVHTESGGEPCKTRYEPKYKYTMDTDIFAKNIGISQLTEQQHQMTSWGLMQVMGGLARELGFRGYMVELCEPEVGLDYGCKFLKKLFEKYGDRNDVIAAYNAGSPRKTTGGLYVNEQYVDKVSLRLRELQSL